MQKSLFPTFNIKPPRTFGYNWSKKKYVECYGGNVERFTAVLGAVRISIDEEVPERCPFALEHLLNSQGAKQC